MREQGRGRAREGEWRRKEGEEKVFVVWARGGTQEPGKPPELDGWLVTSLSTLEDNDWLLSNDPPPPTSRLASTVITFFPLKDFIYNYNGAFHLFSTVGWRV